MTKAWISWGCMHIAEIAQLVWENSHAIEFGSEEVWDESLFTVRWSAARKPQVAWRSYTEGWYWFSVDLTFNELKSLDRPRTLPMNGCDIGETTRSNLKVFGSELLCRTTDEGLLTVYNGHEKSIRDRVRAHFALNNDRTGALGLRHFMLHERTWMLRVFSTPCLENISDSLRPRVERLMLTKSGRSAVESAWRVSHGWPVLCKQ